MGYEVTLVAQADHDSTVDGVTVSAIPRRADRVGRLTNAFRIAGRAARSSSHIFHLHDPELLPVGLLLKARGKRVIYDVHEDVPKQVLGRTWLPRVTRRPLSILIKLSERIAARVFDAVIAATPSIEARFPPDKTELIRNFPLLTELTTRPGAPKETSEYVLLYVGVLTEVRGAREMVRAMELLPDGLNVRLLIAGTVPDSLASELRQMNGWRRVELLGWMDRSHVAKLLSEATLGLVLFHPIPNHVESYPTKMFEYMSAGLPLVASDFPAWRDFLERESCGVVVDPLNPRSIAAVISDLIADPEKAHRMGAKGTAAVRERFNWESEEQSLRALYLRLKAP